MLVSNSYTLRSVIRMHSFIVYHNYSPTYNFDITQSVVVTTAKRGNFVINLNMFLSSFIYFDFFNQYIRNHMCAFWFVKIRLMVPAFIPHIFAVCVHTSVMYRFDMVLYSFMELIFVMYFRFYCHFLKIS